MSIEPAKERPKVALIYNPAVRGFAAQGILLVVLGFLVYFAIVNAAQNIRDHHIPTDFNFWNSPAGFDINQHLIPFSSVQQSTYGQAFLVGLLNTLLVGGIGVVLATFLGFFVGIARLSSNWVVAKLATIYVETLRNIPLLLQLLFWYQAILQPLPDPKQSIALPGNIFLNNRGFIVPEPIFGPGSVWVLAALVLAIVAALVFRNRARVRQLATGQQAPVGLVALGLIIGLPVLAFFSAGLPISFSLPELGKFNIHGGLSLFPEFVALLLGLVLYTATYIAEIVRAGILAVSHGQTEAAGALGLQPGLTNKLIVIPQALRVIIPPLTSHYLNLIKNSSLAVAIGYPDLVQVYMGTVLNQTGAAVQVVLTTMAVYLTISLLISLAMNIYNKKKSLAER